MADATYVKGFEDLSLYDWTAATIRVLLLDDVDGPTFTVTHVTVADVLGAANNTESTGTGYARKTIPTPAVNRDDTNERAELDHGDITYSSADFGTIGAAVYFRETSTTDDTLNYVWFYKDSGLPLTTNGSDATLATGSTGLVHVRAL